jgi:hypothetical protein
MIEELFAVIYMCEGCDNNIQGYCKIWNSPEARFRISRCKTCGTATHIKKDLKRVIDGKERVGQQKQIKHKKKK